MWRNIFLSVTLSNIKQIHTRSFTAFERDVPCVARKGATVSDRIPWTIST
jgi:hypothetical protein